MLSRHFHCVAEARRNFYRKTAISGRPQWVNMSVKVIAIVVCLTLSEASAYSMYFPSNLCEGSVTNDVLQATTQDCPFPGARFPSYTQTAEVTEAAKLKAVNINWFLGSDGSPALNVSVESVCPNSPQEYTIYLLAPGYISDIFCGKVSTSNPGIDGAPQKTSFGLEMRCKGGKLKPGMKVHISVQVKGASTQEPTMLVRYVLPTCDDQTMRESNECKEERKRRIKFHCQQQGNSTLVILNTKTAYLQGKASPEVYVTLGNKDDDALEGWKAARPALKLSWPKRSVRFNDLKIGNTYQVLVWRKGDIKRFSYLVTMKPERKDQRKTVQYTVKKRLVKRKARRTKRFQRQENRL